MIFHPAQRCRPSRWWLHRERLGRQCWRWFGNVNVCEFKWCVLRCRTTRAAVYRRTSWRLSKHFRVYGFSMAMYVRSALLHRSAVESKTLFMEARGRTGGPRHQCSVPVSILEHCPTPSDTAHTVLTSPLSFIYLPQPPTATPRSACSPPTSNTPKIYESSSRCGARYAGIRLCVVWLHSRKSRRNPLQGRRPHRGSREG